MEACPFCALAAGEDDELIALQTEQILVVPALKQRRLNRGHMLVLPNAHVTRLVNTGPELLQELYSVAGRVCMAVRKAFDATGATLFQNDESPDQVLMHLHLHVVPRREGDGFRMPDPTGDVLGREERAQQAVALRHALAASAT